MEEESRYPTSYRADETRQLMDWIRTGQCGCLIGLRGVGKSLYLRFLLREDVQRLYLGDGPAPAFILFDLLSLIEVSEWAVYELILSRLVGQLQRSGVEDDRVAEMTALHREFLRDHESPLAHRAIEQCLDLLCRQPEQRVVLVFDEFDAAFGTLALPLFRFLRALHNSHSGQLSYVISVSKDLDQLREDLVAVDHFYRLVGRNVCRLGPLSETDARAMIASQAARRSLALGEGAVVRLIELSGGHSGLLKACLSLLAGAAGQGDLAWLEVAAGEAPVIRHECRKVWENLPGEEQAGLCALVNGDPVAPARLLSLTDRHLLRGGAEPVIFSPLFASFVRAQAPPPRQGTFVSRSPQIVQIDGRRIESLTEMEFEVLCYLYERRGRVCTKNDLIENVYRQRYAVMQGGVSNDALDALLSRLRRKIEPDPGRPSHILTVRGEGYKFVAGD